MDKDTTNTLITVLMNQQIIMQALRFIPKMPQSVETRLVHRQAETKAVIDKL